MVLGTNHNKAFHWVAAAHKVIPLSLKYWLSSPLLNIDKDDFLFKNVFLSTLT